MAYRSQRRRSQWLNFAHGHALTTERSSTLPRLA